MPLILGESICARVFSLSGWLLRQPAAVLPRMLLTHNFQQYRQIHAQLLVRATECVRLGLLAALFQWLKQPVLAAGIWGPNRACAPSQNPQPRHDNQA